MKKRNILLTIGIVLSISIFGCGQEKGNVTDGNSDAVEEAVEAEGVNQASEADETAEGANQASEADEADETANQTSDVKEADAASDDEDTKSDGPVQVEIENLDDIKEDNTVAAIETEFPEEMTVTVAVCGEPALSILDRAKEEMGKRGYGLRVINCDDYNTPNAMVENGEALACFCEHEGFLTAYNKSHESNLEIYKRIYYEPMAIYKGTEGDLNHIPDGATIAVPENDVSVARALYLLDQKGLLSVKEGCGFQASLEDITDNPHGLVIEKKSPEDVTILSKEYSLYIMEMNQALAAGISESQSLGTENRVSPMVEYFAIGIVTSPENEDSLKLRLLAEAIESERVQKYIEKEYRGTVVSY